MMQWIKNKLASLIQRVLIVDSPSYHPGEYPNAQISSLGKTSFMELVSPYGIASAPPKGSSGVKFNIQGESSNQVGIAYDLSTLPNFQNGEVVVGAFSVSTPTYLKFTQLGTIEVWKAETLIISDLITHIHSGVEPGGGSSGPPVP